jgi:large subunit ribosomal protein L15
MPAKFRRKITRQRGQRSHGWGEKKKHRGKGSRGGKGWGGSTKHKRSYVYTYEPDHFGYRGFHSLKKKGKSINVGELEGLLAKGKTEIDLSELGYTKLLSKGNVSSSIVVKVTKSSPKAKEKIEKAGGKIIAEKVED